MLRINGEAGSAFRGFPIGREHPSALQSLISAERIARDQKQHCTSFNRDPFVPFLLFMLTKRWETIIHFMPQAKNLDAKYDIALVYFSNNC